MQEQMRQRLEAGGAKKYEDWAAEKQRAEQLERQRVAVSIKHAGRLARAGVAVPQSVKGANHGLVMHCSLLESLVAGKW
jgi:hypothetical protein